MRAPCCMFAFAIQAGRRLRRKLNAVEKYNEKATECIELPPNSKSYTFQLILPHGTTASPLYKYALVTQITAISESNKTTTATKHTDIRAFAPFSKNDTLTASLSTGIDKISEINRVEANFRSVRVSIGSRLLASLRPCVGHR